MDRPIPEDPPVTSTFSLLGNEEPEPGPEPEPEFGALFCSRVDEAVDAVEHASLSGVVAASVSDEIESAERSAESPAVPSPPPFDVI